jgi:hypothetical protein
MKPKLITVTWGEEHFSIERFSGFRVGPISITVEVDPNQSVEAAIEQAHTTAEAAGNKIFLAKRNAFHARLKAKN